VKTEKSNFDLCKYSMKFLKMTLMFLKNIGLIEKNIRTFEDKHTILCLQTIGVCGQRTVPFLFKARIFIR